MASVFEIAGITSEVIVTENSEHADSVIQSCSLHDYDGIISVGGDGMFSQVNSPDIFPPLRSPLTLPRYSTLCWCGLPETGSWR